MAVADLPATAPEILDLIASLRKEQYELSSARATRSADFKPHRVRAVRRSIAVALKHLQGEHGVVVNAGKRARRRHAAVARAEAPEEVEV
mmetsp:Transcript_16808/g.37800  ORF Transcript_16808/g.37800 Transcript_16808/m.37800 type:complete len:90 (-) Transcript_16808:115-384(-)